MVVFCVSFCLGIYDSFLPSSKYANSKPIHSLAMTVFFFFFYGMGPCLRVFACTISLQWCLRNSTPSTLVGYPVHVLTFCFSCSLGVASGSQEISEDNSVITVSQCDQLLFLTSIPTLPSFKSLLGLKSEEDMGWA